MAADFVMSVQSIVSREVDPADSAVVTIGSLHSGSQYNVIAGTAQTEGPAGVVGKRRPFA